MAIITKPATINKDEAAVITLDKDELASLASVAGDAYFSVQSNWKKVLLHYLSDVGGQTEVVSFDATLTSPTANFLASATARDNFEIHKIIIEDFDNGRFIVDRAELTTAEFDVALSGGGGGGGGGSLTWSSVASPSIYATTATSVEKLVGQANAWNLNIVSDQTLSGDFYVQATADQVPTQTVIGIQSTTSQSSALINSIDYGIYIDNWNLYSFISKADSYTILFPLGPLYTPNMLLKIEVSGQTVNFYVDNGLVLNIPFGNYSGKAKQAAYRVGVSLFQSTKVENIVFQSI